MVGRLLWQAICEDVEAGREEKLELERVAFAGREEGDVEGVVLLRSLLLTLDIAICTVFEAIGHTCLPITPMHAIAGDRSGILPARIGIRLSDCMGGWR